LPTAQCDGPVLVRVEPEHYESVVESIREMCVHEGDEWMTTLVIRPEDAPTNTGDLEVNGIYILIAHLSLFMDEPEKFMAKLKSMKRLVVH
jgi:abortive infection bacteriophage resistance protein